MPFGAATFGGSVPRVAAHLLPANQATLAQNCWNTSGRLSPIPTRRTVETGGGSPPAFIAMHRYEGEFMAWDEDVDVVQAPVVADTRNRIIWSGDGFPKSTNRQRLGSFSGPATPRLFWRLGIPIPGATSARPDGLPPTVVTQAQTADEDTSPAYHAWVYTYVSRLQEEGPPSPPTAVTERTFDADGNIQPVEITMETGPGSDPEGPFDIVLKRLYRTISAEGGSTAFQLIDEIPVETATYTDMSLDAALGDALITTGWDMPPEDLEGIIALPNGVCAGFVGRDLHFSEPYQPHAWPRDYRQTVDFDIVGLGAYGTTVFIGTEGAPYLASGTDPAAYTLSKQELDAPCVGKRTIASIGQQGIVYAAPDGLVLVGPGGSRYVSKAAYALRDWRSLGMENAISSYHDQRYVAFLDGNRALAFDTDAGEVYEFDDNVAAIYIDRVSDQLFILNGLNGNIEEFRTTPDTNVANRTATWRSKTFRGPLSTYEALQVIQDAGATPTTVNIYASPSSGADIDFSAPVATRRVSGSTPVSLPNLNLARDWVFEVVTNREISAVIIGGWHEMLE